MKPSRPEAESEYSRGQKPQTAIFPCQTGAAAGVRKALPRRSDRALLVGGLAGSSLLLVAEFTPLFAIHTSLEPRGAEDRPDRVAPQLRADPDRDPVPSF